MAAAHNRPERMGNEGKPWQLAFFDVPGSIRERFITGNNLKNWRFQSVPE